MENQYQQGIIQIDNFQGPFDLLLALIKDKKLDIFEVNLVDVVNEYVKIIESLVNENVDLVSEYLVMAASLINLKARLLLKEPSENKKVAKQTQSLLTRLSIYQSFKNLATFLKEREAIGLKVLTKKTSDMSEFVKPVDPTRLDGQGNVIWLIRTVRQMYARLYAHNLRKTTISKFNWSAQAAQKRIQTLLAKQKTLSFTEIFKLPSLLHFAQTFLTILDLARKQEVSLAQAEPYAPISLTKGGQND